MWTVHPRVGGEQFVQQWVGLALGGSSPRGRGTASTARRNSRLPRFIPAWAGNRSSWVRLTIERPVHPRVGGEQSPHDPFHNSKAGSSPRGRGTGLPLWAATIAARFIPAWAGNSKQENVLLGEGAVHPRVGGEQVCDVEVHAFGAGSSPRGRGTGLAPSCRGQ